jgi:hypothetical protein
VSHPATARPLFLARRRAFRTLFSAVIALAAIALVSAMAGDAHAGKKGGGKGQPKKPGGGEQVIEQIRAQIAAARITLTDAEAKITAANAELKEAKEKGTEGQSALKDATEASRSATQKLNEIEKQLLDLDSQKTDSKIKKAETQRDAAKKALDKYRDDHGIEAGSIVEDPEYQTLKDTLKDANHDYEKLKTELFEADAGWKAADEATKTARDKEAEAKGQAPAGAGGTARKDLKKAQRDKAAATAIINAGETQLKAMGVPVDSPKKK